MRVLMLELDSLSLEFTRAHIDRLPTLAHLIENGRLVETESTANIASASVWPTFATGHMPGEHGHYFPFQWHPEKMRFFRPYKKAWAGELEYDPFWYGLARQGYRCQVLDASQCIPRTDSPCLEINDWSTQSSGNALTSNPAVLKEIRRKFGSRPLGAEVPVHKSGKQSSDLLTQIIQSMRSKADAIIWLGETREWDFYLAAIQDVHRAGHNLWPIEGEFASEVGSGALLRAYQAMDREVQRILDALATPSTHVILFTINGMAPNRAQNHFLPQILQRLNRLYLGENIPSGTSARRQGVIAKLRDEVPPSIQFTATKLLGETVQDWVVNREYLGSLNWEKTLSFPLVSGGEGLIRLNIKGRERLGILSGNPVDYEKYVGWLREKLLDIRVSPSELPLVSNVIDLQSLWPGEKSSLLPDIAVEWAPQEPATEISSPAIGRIRKKLTTGRGGNHTGESFAIISDTTAQTGVADSLTHITSYANIVAHLLK